jgi:hypothetical protein
MKRHATLSLVLVLLLAVAPFTFAQEDPSTAVSPLPVDVASAVLAEPDLPTSAEAPSEEATVRDETSVDGAEPTIVPQTTWGSIKTLYR